MASDLQCDKQIILYTMGQKEAERESDIIKGNALQNNYEHITVTKCGGGGGGKLSKTERRKEKLMWLKFFFKKLNWYCNQHI
jgi:hypothetical protein